MRKRLLFTAVTTLLGGSATFIPARLFASNVTVGLLSCGADCMYSCCGASGFGCSCTCTSAGLGACHCSFSF